VLNVATELAMGLEQTICRGLAVDERQQLLGMLNGVAESFGLVQGLHPDTSTGHGSHHWTDDRRPPAGRDGE